ncbi:MAG TPA: hypothetical protein VGB93_11670, partial [Methylovirgula sp.]
RKTEKAIGTLLDGAHRADECKLKAAFLLDDPGSHARRIANRTFVGTDGERMMKALRCCHTCQ